jgi:hypothetical protein
MSITYEEDNFYFNLKIDPSLTSDEQCLKGSSTKMVFKLKVRNIFRYFIVYSNSELIVAKLVKDKKKLLKVNITRLPEIYLSIAQLNIMFNRGHIDSYRLIVELFCEFLIGTINDIKN